MKRYVILFAAVVMQMCLGATYSWSVYVQPLKELTGLLQGPVQAPFSVFYFAFPATMIFSGAILARTGPRTCAVGGGVLFGCGWLLASLGRHHFILTIAGIGLLAGIGVGFAYIVPIATCIRWFPRHKGLVTGIAVAGFGGGAALVSQVGGWLLAARGASPFDTFAVFGAAFLILVAGAGFFMENPPGALNGGTECRPLPASSLLASPYFWVLYLAMFSGLAAGFTVNANLKELSAGRALQTGIAAVSLFALANAAGRVLWGALFDRVRPQNAVLANLLAQAALLLASFWLLDFRSGYLVFAFAAGLNYGGVLVLYASYAARLWGAERVGQTYGWLFSANIPAAATPMLAGMFYDISGSFAVPLALIAAMLVLAAVILGFAGKNGEPARQPR